MQVYKPTLTRFAEAGGLVGNSPAEVSQGNWGHEKCTYISHYLNELVNRRINIKFDGHFSQGIIFSIMMKSFENVNFHDSINTSLFFIN